MRKKGAVLWHVPDPSPLRPERGTAVVEHSGTQADNTRLDPLEAGDDPQKRGLSTS